MNRPPDTPLRHPHDPSGVFHPPGFASFVTGEDPPEPMSEQPWLIAAGLFFAAGAAIGFLVAKLTGAA